MKVTSFQSHWRKVAGAERIDFGVVGRSVGTPSVRKYRRDRFRISTLINLVTRIRESAISRDAYDARFPRAKPRILSANGDKTAAVPSSSSPPDFVPREFS